MSDETEGCSTAEAGNNENGVEDSSEANAEKHEARTDRVDTPETNSGEKKKIDVLLKATGDAPIMMKRKWSVSPQMKIMEIADFIRKYLKLGQSESLFLYINQVFAPSLDQEISNLYERSMQLTPCTGMFWASSSLPATCL